MRVEFSAPAIAFAATTFAAITFATIAFATIVGAGSASASENYPAIIDRQKGVECPRPLTRCLICHDSAAGGEGTANRPFAKALVEEYGLSGGKAGRELAMALERLPDDVDTDADGVPDQEELALCMNPSGGELSEGPGFGCSLRPVGGAATATPWLASWLLVMLSARRRRLRPTSLPAFVLLLGACTPTPISEERFQSRAQTCYEFPIARDAGQGGGIATGLERRDGCDVGPNLAGGAGPMTPAGAGGAIGNAEGSPPPPSSGGAGSPTPPAMPAVPDPAGREDAGPSVGSAGTGNGQPSPLPLGCSEQAILEQFSRPYDMGGCTDPDGTGCHEDGTGEDPILAYPGETVDRLLDQRDAEGCAEVWIPRGLARSEDSFLWQRLNQNVSEDDCEIRMPLDEDPLDQETLSCVSAWIVWLSNGRPE